MKRKKTTLILTQTDPKVDMMFNDWIRDNLNADIIFKKVPKALRAIRRIVANFLPANCLGIWLNDWKKNISSYNTIILHASELTNHLPEYIHHIKPDMRIIYWYWNPVNRHTLPKMVTDSNVEIWTFDKGDQHKYNMKYNIQYYSNHDYIVDSERSKLKYDVFFIGHDKGRKSYIENLKKKMEKQGLKCFFCIIPDRSNKYIPYDVVKKYVSMSKAVLEINQDGQDGYTLRTLESLFMKKKLITNNASLINANFYFKDNIYILNRDVEYDIKHFLEIPYNHKADYFIDKYTVDAWFNNFFVEKK